MDIQPQKRAQAENPGYTDQWQEAYRDRTLDECLDSIENDPMFMP